MSLTVYRDTNYQGPFARIRPGFFSGRDLVGYYNQSAYGSGEDLDNAISSLRVGPNTIAAIYAGQSPTASAGSRVIVGPYDVPDLAALGMDDKVSAIQVLSFKTYDSGIPRSGGATLYSGYQFGGKFSVLERGDYNAARLASEEVKFPDNRLRSIRVSPNVIAILYDGPDFDVSMDAVVVVGPTGIGDLDSVGLLDRVSSIRVLYTDPYDVPGRPATTLGTTRAYFPGGAAGFPTEPPPPPRRPVVAKPQTPAGSPVSLAVASGSPAGTPGGSPSDVQKMWTVIIILFVLVAILAAVVVAQGRRARSVAPRAGEKVGAAEDLPSVTATSY